MSTIDHKKTDRNTSTYIDNKLPVDNTQSMYVHLPLHDNIL